MITFFNIHGAMVYVDEASQTTGYEDVLFTKIEMCRHYTEVGAGRGLMWTSSCASRLMSGAARWRQAVDYHSRLRLRHLDAGFGQAARIGAASSVRAATSRRSPGPGNAR